MPSLSQTTSHQQHLLGRWLPCTYHCSLLAASDEKVLFITSSLGIFRAWKRDLLVEAFTSMTLWCAMMITMRILPASRSAYREQSFGHGILTFVNQTHALFEWNRNQDTFDEYGDQVYIVRTPQTCPNQYGPAALAAAPTPSASIAALVPASAAKAAGAPGPYATVVSSYGPSSPAGYIAALG